MESEGGRAACEVQRPHQTGVLAAVGAQAVDDELQVVAQLAPARVGVAGTVANSLEPCPAEPQQDPVRHVAVPAGDLLRDLGHPPPVLRAAFLDPGVDADPRPRLAEVAEELPQLGHVAVDDELALAFEGALDGLRADVGVAVHVAADPRAEAQEGPRHLAGGVVTPRRAHRRRHRLLESGHHAVDDVDEVEQHVLHLVGHRSLDARVVGGLPDQRDLVAQPCLERRGLLRRAVGALEEVDEDARDPLLLGEDGAPDGLGGVGGQDGLHQHFGQRGADLVGGDAGCGETGRHILQAARLRDARPQSVAAAADAVHALGHVDQREVGRERPCDLCRLPRIEPLEQLVEGPLGGGVAAAPRTRRHARPLHDVEELAATLLGEHLAQHRAEEAHVAAQRVAGAGFRIPIVGLTHGPSSQHGSESLATLRADDGALWKVCRYSLFPNVLVAPPIPPAGSFDRAARPFEAHPAVQWKAGHE